MSAAARILLVDDEPNVLESYRRTLRRDFDVFVAAGGTEALTTIEVSGPFEVVVSDLQMPGMNGVDLLAQVRGIAPETSRILLTGHGNVDWAAAAVNEGRIIQFLTKPCAPDQLTAAIERGVQQFRLVTGERELLEKTLGGSVKVLAEMLGLLSPMAFGSASRVSEYVRHVAGHLGMVGTWRLEIAALLSQLGCITLTDETLNKVHAGQPLEPDEQRAYATHPEVGARLLEKIPRLEPCAALIRRQLDPPSTDPLPDDVAEWTLEGAGDQLLKAALRFDRAIVAGGTSASAIAALASGGVFDPRIVEAFGTVHAVREGTSARAVKVRELQMSMIFDQDVMTRAGVLLFTRGQRVTYPILERLRKFARGVGVEEPIRVQVPSSVAVADERCDAMTGA